MLSIENIKSAYGRIEALHGVTLHVDAGEIVTLIGANGAGKTTLMHAISGVQPITEGAIRYEGEPIEQRPAHARVALGISQVPEGRQIFEPLSVKDNLMLGAWLHPKDGLQKRACARLRIVSDARSDVGGSGGCLVRRTAADACNRSSPDGEASTAVTGRTVNGLGAKPG